MGAVQHKYEVPQSEETATCLGQLFNIMGVTPFTTSPGDEKKVLFDKVSVNLFMFRRVRHGC